MGNYPSYCSSCCCSCCKDKTVNQEIAPRSSVSVITEQPSSSENNANSNSEPAVKKPPIYLPPKHKGKNKVTNNNRDVTDKERKIRVKDSLRKESSNLKQSEKTYPIETFKKRYKEKSVIDYGAFVMESKLPKPLQPEQKGIDKVTKNNNFERSKKEKKITAKEDCRENGEFVDSLGKEPSIISSYLKYKIVTESLRRKSSSFKKKYGDIIGKDEFVKKHSLRRKLSNDSNKSSSLDTYNEICRKITSQIKNLRVSEDNEPQKVTQNSEILTKLLLEDGEFSNFTDSLINDPHKIYTLKQLDENSSDYISISYLFTSTNKRFYRIQKIEKILNPYLFLQYRLKRLEYIARNKNVRERMMFHGTAKRNLDNICRNNFNWRLNGKQFGTKNGKGVNFASNAYFATHYGDTEFNKVMIVAKVLIGKSCPGSRTLLVPPGDNDTTTDYTQKPQNTHQKPKVFVKYDDNTFYPAYIISYGGIDRKHANKGPRRGRGNGRIVVRTNLYNR